VRVADIPALELEALELFFEPMNPDEPDGPRRPLTRDEVLDMAEAALDGRLNKKLKGFAERLARHLDKHSPSLQVEHYCHACHHRWKGASHGSRCPKCQNADKATITTTALRAPLTESPDEGDESGKADVSGSVPETVLREPKSEDADSGLLAAELEARLARDTLDAKIIQLRKEGFTFDEIAKHVGRSKQTIINRVDKMIARRQKYDEDSAA
jgi:hypothetical protein